MPNAGSSPFVSLTTKESPKSSNTYPHKPRASVAINRMPFAEEGNKRERNEGNEKFLRTIPGQSYKTRFLRHTYTREKESDRKGTLQKKDEQF